MADLFTDIARQHAEAVADGRACPLCAAVKGWLIAEVTRLRDLLAFALRRAERAERERG